MEVGRSGKLGAPAVQHAAEAHGRARATVPVLPQPMAARPALVTEYNPWVVMTTDVQASLHERKVMYN